MTSPSLNVINETLVVGWGLELVCLSMASKEMNKPVLITQNLVPYLTSRLECKEFVYLPDSGTE